uniref:At4g08695 n=1 Tax=Arabidopsis thaliana TaxID=3702 RepID=Q6NMS2_ARATH|nr:At4g08695 [Arabidopsis thaliana]AAS46637.1 At4g08695 [Arabidopsis thaliana]
MKFINKIVNRVVIIPFFFVILQVVLKKGICQIFEVLKSVESHKKLLNVIGKEM